MDDGGFDDLLASSRQVAMENPFENPFANHRAGSPDPWATFGTAQSPSAPHEPETTQPDVFGARSTTPTPDTPSFGSSRFQTELEPLDVAAHVEPESPSPSSPFTLSPGFRESISTIDEAITPTPAKPHPVRESTPPSLIPETPPTSPPASSSASQFAPADASVRVLGHATHSSTTSSSSHASKPEPAFHTPLDQAPRSTFERSFAGLSIGGETVGGWQGSQSAFISGSRSATLPRARGSVSDDDDDDDRPILQSARLMGERSHPASAATSPLPVTSRAENGLQPVFMITVDDPQRVGDPIRAFTMYTVHTKTTYPLFSKSSFSVLRRYSDFLWLYETLSMNNPGVVVPPVPEKNPFGRFHQGFVQQRRLALEKCVQKIANHPVLQKDPDLRLFLESDTFSLDIKHRKAEMAHEKGGLMASIGQSIAGPRFHETDEWFDRQKAYLDSLETQLRGLVKAIDAVTKQRTELAAATAEFAQTIADLSTSDVGKQLSNSFTGLAEVERKAQDLQTIQSQEDMVTIMSTVDEYARLINSVRMAFSSRVRTYHAWQNADSNLKRVKQAHESNRAQGKLPTDQLSRSLALVADAERRALDAKQEFDSVSRLVKSEVARFEHERIEDFKESLEGFLEGMISRQKQLIAAWESYQQTLLKKVAPQRLPTDSPVAVS
ncbi:Vacuolar protein sorting-associated protein [Sparassis crispa]|uniref:Vacuolar protein sorting-associated protein n=1 Tax=Sparassis crispa TaxID=139825 RepID=A0A401GW80_9APHY|nr:Vacuolar protein sorting-associated protein [Sparassis crispa]GBE86443.1 Vacuolar protein sorting-associated protein [Sparassis crispa]